MNKFTSQIINQEINNENKKIFYRFDNNLIYIIIIKVIIFIKIVYFMKRREKNQIFCFFIFAAPQSIFSYLKIEFGVKKVSKIIKVRKDKNDKNYLNDNNNKMKENKKINIIIKNVIHNKNAIIINYIIIIASIIINICCQIKNNIFNLFFFKYSKISLKIKGIGDNNILGVDNINSNFQDIIYLKEVYINGVRQDKIENKYKFNLTDNFVELIWEDNITNCQNMFRRCYHITEINLSNFDTSKVTTMFAMFWDCTSLTSIDLSNVNTSKVESMVRMFSNCQLLTSLNLSNFDTKQVTLMNYMFDGCANLEYINLNSFEENNLTNAFNMFNNVPKNFIICINKNIIEGTIYSRIPNKECTVIDCTNDWKSKQKKLIYNNNNECIESCEISSQYKYEYN